MHIQKAFMTANRNNTSLHKCSTVLHKNQRLTKLFNQEAARSLATPCIVAKQHSSRRVLN